MKVNLLLDNPGDIRSGYINIDPFASEDEKERIKGDVHDLSHTVDDGEAIEILALDILDYFPASAADSVLTGWLKKLAVGGVLTLSVVDVREVSRALLANKLTPDELNELLHGQQKRSWDNRKAAYTLQQICQVFEGLGYQIKRKQLENYRAIVTIQRI